MTRSPRFDLTAYVGDLLVAPSKNAALKQKAWGSPAADLKQEAENPPAAALKQTGIRQLPHSNEEGEDPPTATLKRMEGIRLLHMIIKGSLSQGLESIR